MDKRLASGYLDGLKSRKRPGAGICGLARVVAYDELDLFNDLLVGACKESGVYSGCEVYPIRHPRLPPGKAFWVCSRWSIFTRYGRARRRVLRRLIKHFEGVFNEELQ